MKLPPYWLPLVSVTIGPTCPMCVANSAELSQAPPLFAYQLDPMLPLFSHLPTQQYVKYHLQT